jgi:hypothetical protein
MQLRTERLDDRQRAGGITRREALEGVDGQLHEHDRSARGDRRHRRRVGQQDDFADRRPRCDARQLVRGTAPVGVVDLQRA